MKNYGGFIHCPSLCVVLHLCPRSRCSRGTSSRRWWATICCRRKAATHCGSLSSTHWSRGLSGAMPCRAVYYNCVFCVCLIGSQCGGCEAKVGVVKFCDCCSAFVAMHAVPLRLCVTDYFAVPSASTNSQGDWRNAGGGVGGLCEADAQPVLRRH